MEREHGEVTVIAAPAPLGTTPWQVAGGSVSSFSEATCPLRSVPEGLDTSGHSWLFWGYWP